MKKATLQSIREKMGIAFRTALLCLFLTILSVVPAFIFTFKLLETKGQTPITCEVQAVTFKQGEAFATVITPAAPPQTIDVTDLHYSEIVASANGQNTLSIIQSVSGTWQLHHPQLPYAFLVMGIIVQIVAILFSCTSFHLISRCSWRLCFPLALLILMWGIPLYWDAFHWILCFLALPLGVTWGILRRLDTARSQRPQAKTITPFTWQGILIALVVGSAFTATGFFLQYYPLRVAINTQTALNTCQPITLTPHLAKTTHSNGPHSSHTTTHSILASYPLQNGHPQYVELTTGSNTFTDAPFLSPQLRALTQQRFRRLYNQRPVTASISPLTNTIFLCEPKPEDHLLHHETLASLHLSHFIRLLSIPFWIFGLICLGGQTLLLLTPKHRRAPLTHQNALSAQGIALTLKWIVLPTTCIFSLWQWQTCYSRFNTIPIYSLSLLILPILVILICLWIIKRFSRDQANDSAPNTIL